MIAATAIASGVLVFTVNPSKFEGIVGLAIRPPILTTGLTGHETAPKVCPSGCASAHPTSRQDSDRAADPRCVRESCIACHELAAEDLGQRDIDSVVGSDIGA